VRLLYTNQIQTEPIIKYQVMSYQFSVIRVGLKLRFRQLLFQNGVGGLYQDRAVREEDGGDAF